MNIPTVTRTPTIPGTMNYKSEKGAVVAEEVVAAAADLAGYQVEGLAVVAKYLAHLGEEHVPLSVPAHPPNFFQVEV